MRISIRHTTEYRYDPPADWTTQLLRLHPLSHEGQSVENWRVSSAEVDRLPETRDGYGNIVNMLALRHRHSGVTITAEGEVETRDTNGILRGASERLPETYYLRVTDLTQPDDSLRALAASMPPKLSRLKQLHTLMGTIRERVAYTTGSTLVTTTAAEVLAHGNGVCQDLAHVFICGARLLGAPARYVSGYLWEYGRDGQGAASHAWAEAHVEHLGWVGFDPANGVCPTEAYVRVATGLDYYEAAPVRGLRHGVTEETLAVRVDVQQVQAQQ
jgi:transglutaminase-like putative cysteine protease